MVWGPAYPDGSDIRDVPQEAWDGLRHHRCQHNMAGVGQWDQNQEKGQEDLGSGENWSRLYRAYFLKRKIELQKACPLLVGRGVATASHLSRLSLCFLFPRVRLQPLLPTPSLNAPSQMGSAWPCPCSSSASPPPSSTSTTRHT